MDRVTVVEDKRSKKIVVATHCILNQNAKIQGIAKFPGVITPVVDFLVKSGLGILQMPCPETTYLGIRRWQYVKEQYDTPAFREHCKKLADFILNQIEDYQKSGYKIVAILGADGSPSCGVNKTPRNPTWSGLIPEKLPSQKQVAEKGVYMEVLEDEMKKKNLNIPLIGIPETPEVGSMEDALSRLKKLL
nr:CD3072 family TudS-related putative desulfidase [Candidatus Hecatella orcuttiae]